MSPLFVMRRIRNDQKKEEEKRKVKSGASRSVAGKVKKPVKIKKK